MDLSLKNDVDKTKENENVNEFINELSNSLNNTKDSNLERYSEFWKYRSFIEEDVAMTIGISRFSAYEIYNNEIESCVEEEIMELAKEEGTLYRKQFSSHNSNGEQIYETEKFENGKKTTVKIPIQDFPSQYASKDVIFQYNDEGEVIIRDDLKEKIVQIVADKCAEFKQIENEKAAKFKVEGEIYYAFNGDNYTFLENSEGDRLEDIDFLTDNYEREGYYQVINGEYKKIDDNLVE